MKRARVDDTEIEAMAMANCLMLLSKVGNTDYSSLPATFDRMFECKTCNKKFSSFQALGGHRASHKKPKNMINGEVLQEPISPKKTKTTHECSICGLEFAIGQALGGHMRRHRAETTTSNSSTSSSELVTRSLLPIVPVLKKSNSSIKRVWGLDLNLALVDSDLDLNLQGKAHVVPQAVDCFH
ncbi:zinc finger protein ZAT12-like [Rutidosis leptorrhynchoides]|uniref:zinc finger protein ZAT12-like n=1 Tax=Rutidosis leptorrhynchoides TaxID=125765 RepID=UPI003A9A5313